MDFKKIKQEALKIKDKVEKAGKDAVEYSAGKLADSSLTLKSVKDVEKFIEKSKATTGTDSSTGKDKNFNHEVIIIFADTKSDFFKDLLYRLPILSTKAFSQNIALRLADISMKDLDAQKHQIGKIETLVVFEDMKVIKTLEGEENIQKVVKSLSLDINKSIEEL